jgi:hypothetical protein
MKKVPSWFPFILALSFALFGTVFFPFFRLWPFSPFLAIIYHRVNFIKALWISLVCGLILDVFSSQFRFGLFSLNTCLTTLFLYSQKRHFFEDKPIALSLFSAFLSCFQSLCLLVVSSLFDKQFSISLSILLSDLVIMPFLDAIYAFIWFTCPMKIYQYIQRYGWFHLFSKEENER